MTDERLSALRDPLVRRAIRAAIPLFIPAVPFALVLGVAITESAMPTAVGWSTNIFIFAGASQLAAVSLASTATWFTLVATAVVINLRHAMYSAALSHRFSDQPKWFRWIGSFLLIDQLFALVAPKVDLSSRDWRIFYLSAGIFNFVVWNITVTAGLVVGSAIPTEWRLDVAPAIMFAGLVAIGLTTSPGVVAAITGSVVCLLTLSVPNNAGILIAAICGVVAGYLADVAQGRRTERVAARSFGAPAGPSTS